MDHAVGGKFLLDPVQIDSTRIAGRDLDPGMHVIFADHQLEIRLLLGRSLLPVPGLLVGSKFGLHGLLHPQDCIQLLLVQHSQGQHDLAQSHLLAGTFQYQLLEHASLLDLLLLDKVSADGNPGKKIIT